SPALERDPPTGTLVDCLSVWSERCDGPVLLILDQFEEYFLYHSADAVGERFVEELSSVLRRRDLLVNVLISIREDAIARLDRFDGLVPGLMDNLLRIEHLDRDAAREAIEDPLLQWNRLDKLSSGDVTIEPDLVREVLDEVESGKVRVGLGGGPM